MSFGMSVEEIIAVAEISKILDQMFCCCCLWPMRKMMIGEFQGSLGSLLFICIVLLLSSLLQIYCKSVAAMNRWLWLVRIRKMTQII